MATLVTDEQLLADHSIGRATALPELIGRYQQELFAFLYRFVADSAAAEDLFQEAFIQVHKNAGSFDQTRRFRPWLFTIAANKARDYLRSHNRHLTHSLDKTAGKAGSGENEATFLDLMAANSPMPIEELQTAENIARVQGVLATLNPLYKEVLVMSYFHQFAYKEIADMLHIPLGTVKSRLHAAVAAFAKAYKFADSGE